MALVARRQGGPVQSAVTATDFDGDGHLDYVLSARFQSGGDDKDSVWVYPRACPMIPRISNGQDSATARRIKGFMPSP